MSPLAPRAFDGGLAAELARPAAGATLYWLGQAGFALRTPAHTILIDPYLSDTLARKYEGKRFSHERMMPPPVTVEALPPVDLVLVTHQHGDHLDGGTLAPLARRFSDCRFVVPKAAVALAVERIGVGSGRLVAVDAGDVVEPLPGLAVRATRAAHETLERDEAGNHRFLGYAVTTGGLTLFHSGDSIPFPGQTAEVAALGASVALLPVNGRSAELASEGIAGNFTLDEAVGLCVDAGIQAMIAHHYGLFAFNTLDPAVIDAGIAPAGRKGVDLHRAVAGIGYEIVKAG